MTLTKAQEQATLEAFNNEWDNGEPMGTMADRFWHFYLKATERAMTMNDNNQKLLIQLGHSVYVLVAGKTEKSVLLQLIRAVESDRATSEQLSEIGKDVEKVFGPTCKRCGYATTHCKCSVENEQLRAALVDFARSCEQRCKDQCAGSEIIYRTLREAVASERAETCQEQGRVHIEKRDAERAEPTAGEGEVSDAGHHLSLKWLDERIRSSWNNNLITGKETERRIQDLRIRVGVLERERTDPTAGECDEMDDRAEPTATEPDVPDEDRCRVRCTDGRRCVNRAWTRPDGSLNPTCMGFCNFGSDPDVPSEGEEERTLFNLMSAAYQKEHPNSGSVPPLDYREGWETAWSTRAAQAKRDTETAPDVPYKHCSACGMRSHGTNAELRTQVDELRAKLDKANELAVLANNIIEKAGGA